MKIKSNKEKVNNKRSDIWKKQTAATEEPVTQFAEGTEAIVSYKKPHSSHFHNPENARTVPSFSILRLTYIHTLTFPSFYQSSLVEGDGDGDISAAVWPGLNPKGGKPKRTWGCQSTQQNDSASTDSWLLLFKILTVEMLFLVMSQEAVQSPAYQVVKMWRNKMQMSAGTSRTDSQKKKKKASHWSAQAPRIGHQKDFWPASC